MSAGEQIGILAKQKGISLRKLAIKAGIPYNTLYSFVKRKSDRISPDTLQCIAEALGIPFYQWLTPVNSFERVETILKERSITHQQLADGIGINIDQLESSISLGRISSDTFARIGKFLDESPEYLNGLPEDFNDSLAKEIEKRWKEDDSNSIRADVHMKIDELNDDGVKKASDFVEVLYSNPQYVRKAPPAPEGTDGTEKQ